MEKKYDFTRDENIIIKRGKKRLCISFSAISLGVSGEQKADLESMFTALTSTIEHFIDDNGKNFERTFPETED